MPSYQYCGDKTIVRLSYLHNGISYTGKMTSLYWIRALVVDDNTPLPTCGPSSAHCYSAAHQRQDPGKGCYWMKNIHAVVNTRRIGDNRRRVVINMPNHYVEISNMAKYSLNKISWAFFFIFKQLQLRLIYIHHFVVSGPIPVSRI